MMYSGKSRHLRWRYHTVRELLYSGIIIIEYVHSKDNVLDPLTKGLSREGVKRASKGMDLRPRISQQTDCRALMKGKKKDQENVAESKKEIDNLCSMISECNLVGNPRDWWMDFGATHHVCANKELFSTFAPDQGEEKIFMANSVTAKVEETGKVCLKMTSSKMLTLNNVLAGEEVEWLQNFLEDIHYWPKPVAPVCIHCDSQVEIGRAGSMMYNGKSRNIKWRHNTIRELLSSGIITVDYVKSKDNASDPLTKGLSREGVERTSKGMGLRPRTSQHGGNST
ncbi:hypothetical protein T459_24982 [Capsicum annuum]|uniref:Retrovirus-related Pol polyprotein from transposon TNT 1-94-like beta-barrel domain-containing protein n=1 Tax=Capsicum annuum TaxID=4072 RepID=A0A2G2YJF7_CAPAN|nr:hypothetical protein T459_24982 [Capsicum annuum]